VIANFALALNLLLVLAAMAGLQSVLTLPGIAGLVLTLGMAVDANVLINERVREERARGKTLRLAIQNGYDRAFITILDSNLTTLITAFILFGIGRGPVKGFATTLMFGVAISMFTAVWVTRVIVNVLVENGWIKSLHMMRFLGKPKIGFSRLRHLAMSISALCIVIGLAVFGQRWASEQIKDTDLTGGFRAEMELREGLPIDEFRSRVSARFRNADVQSVWTDKNRAKAELPKRFSVRVRKLDDEQRNRKMFEDIEGAFKGKKDVLHSLEQTGPWQFRLQLSRALSENEVRKRLADAGLLASDIRRIVLEREPATEFVLRLRSAALGDQPDKEVANLLDALDALIVKHDVRMELGNLVEHPARTGAGSDNVPRASVTLLLGESCSTAAVREAIVRDLLGGERPELLDVVGDGPDAGAVKCRQVAAHGSRAVIRRIVESGKTQLRVFSYSWPALAEVQLSLEPAQKETELRDRLNQAKLLVTNFEKPARLVRSVIPLNAAGKTFALHVNELSEGKGVEKIKHELKQLFEKEIASEKITATITPADASADLAESDDLLLQGFRIFKLNLDREVQLQRIQATLVRAGYSNALAEEIVRGSEATKVVKPDEGVYLKLSGEDEEIRDTINNITFAFANPDPFRSIETIGESVSKETRDKALLAVLLSCAVIVFYIWFRFGEVKFGLAAVIALVHDVLLTAGAVGVADALSGTGVAELLGLSDIKVNVTMIAAFLTLIGYSINDTIVVFDRIRENMGGGRRKVDAALVDASVNQILSRTILTSFTTFMALIVLYVMGGKVIHGFAFVMTFGVLVGTYSSIFIASPILIGWESYVKGLRKAYRFVTFRFD